tara:strand:- start:512 stop:1909 length:1398 start_codon:yes stop_codon:yes gene_type:complete
MNPPSNNSLEQQHLIVDIGARLKKFFERRGYELISTPMLERTDLYLKKSGGELASRMYSFTDPSGVEVSIRPEFTSSVVKNYVDGALKGPLPQRWTYSGSVFRYEPGSSGEFQQIGAELLGAGSSEADAEIVAMASQSLTTLGVRGHKIRIGHMGVLAALLESLGLSKRACVFLIRNIGQIKSGDVGLKLLREQAARLGLLSSGNNSELARITREMPPEDAMQMVKGFVGDGMNGALGQRTPEEIITRYLEKLREEGQAQVFDRAIELCTQLVSISGAYSNARKKLTRLASKYRINESIFDPIDSFFTSINHYDVNSNSLLLDLSSARGISYYTGVIFDIDSSRIKNGRSIGGGGRYDGLVEALGGKKPLPAMGFALNLDLVAKLLPKNFDYGYEETPAKILVTAQETAFSEAVSTAERLRAQGFYVELDFNNKDDKSAAKYAQQRDIQTVMRVGQDGRVSEQFV